MNKMEIEKELQELEVEARRLAGRL